VVGNLEHGRALEKMVTGNEIPQGPFSILRGFVVRKFEACHHFFRMDLFQKETQTEVCATLS
jgi:hypothetical protein